MKNVFLALMLIIGITGASPVQAEPAKCYAVGQCCNPNGQTGNGAGGTVYQITTGEGGCGCAPGLAGRTSTAVYKGPISSPTKALTVESKQSKSTKFGSSPSIKVK